MPILERSGREHIRFWRRTSVRRILKGIAAIASVVIYGTTGFVLLGWSLLDAVYMVAITMSTVGYGEVRPVTGIVDRSLTITIIVLGSIAGTFTLAAFVQFLAEGEILQLLGWQRMRRQIELLSGHTIIAGFGRIGLLVAEDLARAGLPFLVIDRSPEKLAIIEARGYLCISGDATEEAVLAEAGLNRAKVLVTAMPSDAQTVFITLTARQMAPDVMIVARAEQPTTEKKLRQAGADHVVLPAAIGAHRIVSLLTNPSAVEFIELVTQRHSLEIEMDDIPIRPGTPLIGTTLRAADIGRRTGVMVIAIKRADGRLEFPPSGDEPIVAGDSIVVIGRRANLEQLRREIGAGD